MLVVVQPHAPRAVEDCSPRTKASHGALLVVLESRWIHDWLPRNQDTMEYDVLTMNHSNPVTSQPIGIINDAQNWLGLMGLGAKGTTMNQMDMPSYLYSLAGSGAASTINNSAIPSLSYGYTAGASYSE